MSGSFGALTEPASGLAAGTRFDTLYGSNAISLAVTPSFYGNLAAAGVAESSSESAVGTALDAIRPAPGVAMDPAQSALFDPLYTLPAGNIAVGLDELAPSIYPDTMITARNSWYLMANAVSGQLAARRGLAADHAANSAPGPNGSTIWVSGLAGYDTVGAGGGSPGFTAGLGGTAAGIDMPVAGTAAYRRGGRNGRGADLVAGQRQRHQQHGAVRDLRPMAARDVFRRGAARPDVSAGECAPGAAAVRYTTRGDTNGLAGGGGVRVGVQQDLGEWLIEPSLGFGGFHLHLGSVAETGGALAENIGGATLGSAESTLAVSAQRAFALSETVRMTAKGRLGWSHEFADNTATSLGKLRGPERQRLRVEQRADRARRRAGRAGRRHQGGVLAGGDVRRLWRRVQRQQQRPVVQCRRALHLVAARAAASTQRSKTERSVQRACRGNFLEHSVASLEPTMAASSIRLSNSPNGSISMPSESLRCHRARPPQRKHAAARVV